ncbi:hypothetical protein [Pararhizobium arenae]|uniref:hypothetical protein n=1 Tax=Pararhizobium arenae TaxID=1856850 RepID=UPI00094AF9E2|nr:hypothetical protein [Pararhizobium arenae]
MPDDPNTEPLQDATPLELVDIIDDIEDRLRCVWLALYTLEDGGLKGSKCLRDLVNRSIEDLEAPRAWLNRNVFAEASR